MKKRSMLTVFFVVIFTLLNASLVSAETIDRPTISFTSFDVIQGDTFTTSLYFEKNSNVCQSTLTMIYDTDKVELIDCSTSEDSMVEPTINTTVEGQIKLSFASGKNINAELYLVDVTFKVSDTLTEGSYDLLEILDSESFTRRLNDDTIVENVDYTYNTPVLNIYKAGDINLDGYVDGMDAVYILRYEAGLNSGRGDSSFYIPFFANANDYTEHQKFILKIADAYYDNSVNGSDAVSILRHEAGFKNELLGNRINVNFYNGDNKLYVSKSIVFGSSLDTLPKVPKKEGYPDGKWSLNMSEYVEPDFKNLETNISIFPFYDSSSFTTEAIEYYKKYLTEMYYNGDLSTGLSSNLSLIETLKYQAGYKANIVWSSSCNPVLNSTTGQFTKPTYPQDLTLTAKIISYDGDDMIEGEDSISFNYNVDGMYQTPTKKSIEDFLNFYFTDEIDGKYRVNYDVKLITKINNTIIPVEGAMYDNFEIRLSWYQNIEGELIPINQIKRTTSSQLCSYVAIATFNGKPLEDDGKIYVDDVEITAIDQLEIKNHIINQIAAKQGTLATDGTTLWNDDSVYDTTVTWETGNADIAYVANNEVKLKDDAITGTTLPLNARVSYNFDGEIEEFLLSYNLTVSCDNTIIKSPENMDPGLYKAIKMELECSGDLTSAALANIEFVNLDLSNYQKLSDEYQILRAEHPEKYADDVYPQITSFKGLSYCKNLRTLNISGITITDGSMNQISTLSSLEAFIARGCNLDNLSDGGEATLKNATGLKMIDLTDNNFTSLDSVFADGVRYGSLREVYLSNNKLVDIKALERAPMMSYLSLSGNGLTTDGTVSIANYPYLQYLSLANNKIDSVEYLKGLKYIKELRLQNNKLSNVDDLRRLVSLEILYLGHNDILNVTYLNSLINLQILYLNDNRINDISALGDLSELEVINVSNNNLSSINILVNYKSTLKEVYAENNDIVNFSFINDATNIHILMLAGNKLEFSQDNMESWLSKLTEMQVLTLSDISLTGLGFLDYMPELIRLDVANCALNAFSGEISNIQAIANRYEKLRVLDISNNDFTDNENEIVKLKNNTLLSVLYADNICNNLNVQLLTYSMTELKYISLENCGISSIDWLEKFNNLIYVDLAGNNIANVDLQEHFSNASIKTLRELYLDTNVPCTFENAYRMVDFNVEKLSLSGINVAKIENLPILDKIKYLNLDKTGLKNLTGDDIEVADMYSIERFETLNILDISNLDADISPIENMGNIKTVYAVGDIESERFYENNLHALERLHKKGIECYLYDKNTVYEPISSVEGGEILKLIEDLPLDITVAAENVFSDNNPVLISEINDFDVTWTVSNSKNYEIIDNHLSVRDYAGICDETLIITATIKVYPDQEAISREFIINTHILRASEDYYELEIPGGLEYLTRGESFDVVLKTTAVQTEGFENPVKPVEDGIEFSYDAKDGIPYINIVSVEAISDFSNETLYGIQDGMNYTVKSNAPLNSKLTIKVDMYHLNNHGEKIYDIEQICIPITVASRTFTVNFEMNGGKIVDKKGNAIESCVLIEDSLIFENYAYSKSGYEFKGWYKDSQFNELFSIDDADAIMPSEDITLYAKWKAHSFKLLFDANGGSVSESSRTVLCDTAFGTLPTPTRDSYIFDGWYTSTSGGTKVTNTTTRTEDTDLTLYAHWTLNTFKVTFNANGGTVSETNRTISCNTQFGALPTPTRDYYTFDGWYTSASGGSEITSSTTKSDATNMTVYAHWTQNSVSGWVKASSVPSGAQITSQKWTYDLTSYTTSSSSSLSGWTKYDTKSQWSDYGSWSSWSDNWVGASDSREVQTQEVIASTNYKTVYHYFRYAQEKTGGYGHYVANSSYPNYFTYEFDSELPYTDSTGGGRYKYWYNGTNYISVYKADPYTTQEVVSHNYKTQYRYRDRHLDYTYYYKKTEAKESSSYPTGDNISNIVEWVQYRAK